MAEWWASSDAGDAGNGGTSKWDAMDTIAGAVALASDEDIIKIDSVAPYNEGDVDPAGRSLILHGYNGLVDWNATGNAHAIYNSVSLASNPFIMVNISINGWTGECIRSVSENSDDFYLFNCILYLCGALYQPSAPNYVVHEAALHTSHSTLWGVRLGINGAYRDVYNYNTIIRNCVGNTAPREADYNAAPAANQYGVHGFNSDTYPPPFVSENTTTPNLSLNKAHAQWLKYATEGRYGGRIGATGTGSDLWCIDPYIAHAHNDFHMALQGNVVLGDWENDTSHWYDSSWENKTISALNDRCDFNEGGPEITATVASNTYTSGAALATAIQVALNAVGTATFTVQYTSNLRFTVSSDGATFELPWLTGTNTATSIGADIGFDVSADDTGTVVYSGDYAVTVGAVGDGNSEAMPAIWDGANRSLKPNILIEPNKTQARVKSDLVDRGGQATVNAAYVGKTITGTGNVRLLEVRASNEAFDKDDDAGTTTLDWTEMTPANNSDFNQTYRYWQYRVMLDLDV